MWKKGLKISTLPHMGGIEEIIMAKEGANASMDVAGADAGASGVVTGTAAGQSTGSTFTEGGHAQMSDVNVQELQSVASGLLAISAATLKSTQDTVQALAAHNAQTVQHLANLSNQLTQDLSNKAAHRHSEIAADRQWNLDEQPAWFAILAEQVADILNAKS